jgi:hypothetical protein
MKSPAWTIAIFAMNDAQKENSQVVWGWETPPRSDHHFRRPAILD